MLFAVSSLQDCRITASDGRVGVVPLRMLRSGVLIELVAA